jgi:hypothetical protein
VDGNLAENELPRAKADTRALTRRQFAKPKPMTIPVLTNDRDADRDRLSISEISNPQFGSASLSANGRSILYTPGPLPRTEAFTYVCGDGRGGTARAQVLIRRRASGSYQGVLRNSEGVKQGRIAVVMTAIGTCRSTIIFGGTTEDRTRKARSR